MLTFAPTSFNTSPPELSDDSFTRLAERVRRHCGLHLHEGKRELVRARLAAPMRAEGFTSLSAYISDVLNRPGNEGITSVIDLLTTNLTAFFREPQHFHFLAETFLPRLLERKEKEGNRRLRAWSAGCSTGEEAYSIAMTLLEVLGPRHRGWDVKVLATDISSRVLIPARAGEYPLAKLQDLPEQHQANCLPQRRSGETAQFTVDPAIRALIFFRRMNLIEPWPFAGTFDFIFCRNVMIYFERHTRELLVGRFHDRLNGGGHLFIGHAESFTGISHRFRYVAPTIYAK